jgi:ketosteroid isomerase-like protein
MGEAREAMDRVTAATTTGDAARIGSCYSEDAVLIAPDEEIRGREAIAAYFVRFGEAFPDTGYEFVGKFEDGATAIDETWVTGTNTGPLSLPTGDTVPPTGKQIRVRSCDIAEVANGVVIRHRMYFNPADFEEQLGLG